MTLTTAFSASLAIQMLSISTSMSSAYSTQTVRDSAADDFYFESFGSRNVSSLNITDAAAGKAAQSIAGEDALAAALVAAVAVAGLIANGAVVACGLARMVGMTSQFCQLYVSLSAADVGVLLMFLCWVAPMSAISELPFASSPGARKAGIAMLGIFFASFWCQFSMAVNRLIAVYWPRQYATIYSPRNLKINILLNYVLGFFLTIPYYNTVCDFEFNAKLYIWQYSDNECGFILDKLCSAVCILAVSSVFVVNVLTYYKIRRLNAARREKNVSLASDASRSKKEMSFFIQTCINGGLYISTAILIHIVARIPMSKWVAFSVRTILWEAAHTVSGLVFLIYNQEIRHGIMKCCGKQINSKSIGESTVTMTTKRSTAATSLASPSVSTFRSYASIAEQPSHNHLGASVARLQVSEVVSADEPTLRSCRASIQHLMILDDSPRRSPLTITPVTE